MRTCVGRALARRSCTDGVRWRAKARPTMRSGRHRRDDAVGGVGQVGEAVGQAGAGEDEAVGVFVLGDAELGQQVQVVAQGLQFGVGVGGQVIAGVGERSVRHGGVLPCGARRACGRALRPQGVGRFEAGNHQPGVFPLRVFY
jgi:hypothetical protein